HLALGYSMEVMDLNLAGAAVEYRRAARLAPQNPALAFRLAAMHGYIGDFTASVESYRHVLQLDPLSARAHLYLGVTLSRLGRQPEAEAVLRKAIELQPQAAVQRSALSNVLVLQGR